MEAEKSCLFCGSSRIRQREGIIRIRVMPVVGGGPGVERTFPIYHCLACGRSFDEIEAKGSRDFLQT
jgi:hypothetical protein